MKFYLDITLLPDAENNLGFLWQKIFGQLHLALVEMKTANDNSVIAVSFSEYGSKIFPLGNKLRLFATTQTQLHQLDIGKWLSRLTDYCHYTPIKEAPHSVNKYARFKRKQFRANTERLARRRASRKGELIEQAIKHFDGFNAKESKLPYIHVESLSGKRRFFKLFVEKEILDKPIVGNFSCYGLSNHATVPCF